MDVLLLAYAQVRVFFNALSRTSIYRSFLCKHWRNPSEKFEKQFPVRKTAARRGLLLSAGH